MQNFFSGSKLQNYRLSSGVIFYGTLISYFDRYFDIEMSGKMEPNTWHNVVFIEYSEEIRNIEKTKLQIFAWLAGQGSFKIDDLRLSVYEGLR
jgi:hypothetical protein